MKTLENPNVNCLEGYSCPQCGSFGPFNVAITQVVIMSDDGWSETSEQYDGDEWTGYISCRSCPKEGTLSEFKREVTSVEN